MKRYIHQANCSIGKRLQDKRQSFGLSLIDLAERVGVPFHHILNVESGKSVISAGDLFVCAHLLDVDLDYFFKDLVSLKKPTFIDGGRPAPDQAAHLHVLLIEDDEASILLTQKAFNACTHHITLTVMRDGEGLFPYLHKATTSHPFLRPDIILLDLNLPKTNGLSILKRIKNTPTYADIPVVILTGMINPKDKCECYKAHASGYITKPLDFSVFQANIDIFAEYWAHTVVLPHRHEDVSCQRA